MNLMKYGIFLLMLLLFPLKTEALQIEAVNVGFSGYYEFYSINPLSVKVHNPGNEPYDGTIALGAGFGMSNQGGSLLKEVYIPPHESQWVQFYPYFQTDGYEFALFWGKGLYKRLLINLPKIKKRQPIYISRDSSVGIGATNILSYPEEFFPPIAGALEPLDCIVLDHVPRWQKVRRMALRDWVYQGGTLHIFKESTGEYPQFESEMSDFNGDEESKVYGGGAIIRHPFTMRETSKSYMGEKVRSHLSLGKHIDDSKEDKTNEDYGYIYDVSGNMMQSFFGRLRNMTRPEHNWLLIFFLSVIYLLAIFPGAFLLGRKRFDYKLIYGYILSAIVIMSFTFWKIGQRGYNEKTMLNSIAVAHDLGDGRYNVKSWNSAFVTSGDYYTIKDDAEGSLYSCPDSKGSYIVNGAGGYLKVDIPPFTSHTYMHEGVYKTEKKLFELKEFQAVASLEEAVIQINPGTGFDPEGRSSPDRKSYVTGYYNGVIYDFDLKNYLITLKPASGKVVKKYISDIYESRDFDYYRYSYYGYQNRDSTDKAYKELNLPLLLSALDFKPDLASRYFNDASGNNGLKEDLNLKLPADNVLRLYVYGKPVEEFRQTPDILKEMQGRVLYVQDFNLAEKQ